VKVFRKYFLYLTGVENDCSKILGTTSLDNVFCLFAGTNTQGAVLFKEVSYLLIVLQQ
jgi:hypothetical protein